MSTYVWMVAATVLGWCVSGAGYADPSLPRTTTPGVPSTADGPALEAPLADCVVEPNVLARLSSSEFGLVQAIHVEMGDRIESGQVVAELATDVERASVELSEARAHATGVLALHRQQHAFAARNRERLEALHANQVISAEQFDEARTNEELAASKLQETLDALRVARRELARDQLALRRRYIRSPIDGVVVKRHKQVGEYAEGEPVLEVAQLDPLRIEVIAPIELLGRIRIGMKADVRPEAGPGAKMSLQARVTHIDPIPDLATATFGIRLSVPNPDAEHPAGLRCEAHFRAPVDGAQAAGAEREGYPFEPVEARSQTTDPMVDQPAPTVTRRNPAPPEFGRAEGLSDEVHSSEGPVRFREPRSDTPVSSDLTVATPTEQLADLGASFPSRRIR